MATEKELASCSRCQWWNTDECVAEEHARKPAKHAVFYRRKWIATSPKMPGGLLLRLLRLPGDGSPFKAAHGARLLLYSKLLAAIPLPRQPLTRVAWRARSGCRHRCGPHSASKIRREGPSSIAKVRILIVETFSSTAAVYSSDTTGCSKKVSLRHPQPTCRVQEACWSIDGRRSVLGVDEGPQRRCQRD